MSIADKVIPVSFTNRNVNRVTVVGQVIIEEVELAKTHDINLNGCVHMESADLIVQKTVKTKATFENVSYDGVSPRVVILKNQKPPRPVTAAESIPKVVEVLIGNANQPVYLGLEQSLVLNVRGPIDISYRSEEPSLLLVVIVPA
jgi:hypothetical protein